MIPYLKLNAHKASLQYRSSKDKDVKFERAKNLATIVSAIAIPLVLAIAGYLVQKELSREGLKKDYVGIATNILKEQASNQEPELRVWAVKVLDENSPVPFSKKALEGLRTGGVVLPGPAWMSPPADCLKAPGKRTLYSALQRLNNDTIGLDQKQLSNRLSQFIDVVVKEERAALMTAARLECLQQWIASEEQADIDYRNAIGAPTSKSVYEQKAREKAASAMRGTSPTTTNIVKP